MWKKYVSLPMSPPTASTRIREVRPMNSQRVLFFCCITFALLPVQAVLCQQTANDDIQTSLRSCDVIRAALEARLRLPPNRSAPTDDDYTAAGQACDMLNAAITTSDPQQIQSAAKNLRPILARLGMAPATPQEQLAALESEFSVDVRRSEAVTLRQPVMP